uniref:Nuclear pore complex protein Nup85 n=1 Tax=Lactuca sativa TaxID=4236 RepID=A0A9R1W6E0_LACSA|nr:hypothetical protein LSAT_V11C300126670 [Lactuca sativa]
MVQWAMRLPTRHCFEITNSDSQNCDQNDGIPENGAIVCVGDDEFQSDPSSSPDHDSILLPKELEGLHEKYSATLSRASISNIKLQTREHDGKEIAFKILKSSEDFLKEFMLEIEIIIALNHQNIISLFGLCFEDNNLLLVYDFLSRGSLEDNLHSNEKYLAFGWSERYKGALGVAEALFFIYTSSLSGFGLAKWGSTTSSHITCTDVAGTFGMIAHATELLTPGNIQVEILLKEERHNVQLLLYCKQNIEICRLYNLDSVSPNDMKIAIMHHWKHGRKGSRIFWLQQAHDEVRLNRNAQKLFDFVGKRKKHGRSLFSLESGIGVLSDGLALLLPKPKALWGALSYLKPR